MMDREELINYSNSYVNIPVFILTAYWRVNRLKFEWFLINVMAFGTATEQLIRLVEDGNTFEGVTCAVDDNLELIMNFIEEWDSSNADVLMNTQKRDRYTFDSLAASYKNGFKIMDVKIGLQRFGGWESQSIISAKCYMKESNGLKDLTKGLILNEERKSG